MAEPFSTRPMAVRRGTSKTAGPLPTYRPFGATAKETSGPWVFKALLSTVIPDPDEGIRRARDWLQSGVGPFYVVQCHQRPDQPRASHDIEDYVGRTRTVHGKRR